MQQRRAALGGYLPSRSVPPSTFKAPDLKFFAEWTADFAAARGRDELGAKPNERERGGIEF
jgi:hypothetical protein